MSSEAPAAAEADGLVRVKVGDSIEHIRRSKLQVELPDMVREFLGKQLFMSTAMFRAVNEQTRASETFSLKHQPGFRWQTVVEGQPTTLYEIASFGSAIRFQCISIAVIDRTERPTQRRPRPRPRVHRRRVARAHPARQRLRLPTPGLERRLQVCLKGSCSTTRI